MSDQAAPPAPEAAPAADPAAAAASAAPAAAAPAAAAASAAPAAAAPAAAAADDDASRLAQLKRAAEAQMSRSAPPIGGGAGDAGDDRRKAKRHKREGAADEASEELPSRYSYAAADAVAAGVPCFLATCEFRREKSTTFEVADLLGKLLPGAKLQLVKVDCNGLVVVTAAPAEGQAAAVPSAVVRDMLERMTTGSLTRTKFAQRIMPADTTCLLAPGPLRDALAGVVAAFISKHCSSSAADDGDGAAAGAAERAPLEFAVMWKQRGADAAPTQQQPAAAGGAAEQEQQQQQQQSGAAAGLDRKAVTDLAAEVVRQCCKHAGLTAKVNLTKPQAVVVVEAVPVARQQLAAAVAVLPGELMVCKPRFNIKPCGRKA